MTKPRAKIKHRGGVIKEAKKGEISKGGGEGLKKNPKIYNFNLDILKTMGEGSQFFKHIGIMNSYRNPSKKGK